MKERLNMLITATYVVIVGLRTLHKSHLILSTVL